MVSSYWNSYLTRLFPGWLDDQTPFDKIISLLIVFMLTFTAEFCSKYPIKSKQSNPTVEALTGGVMQGLKMFMTYLAVVAIIATDFVFFLAAVGGHAVGDLVGRLYQYHIDQAEVTLYDGSY